MSWARFDDAFPEHPKVIGLSDRAFRLHVKGICYAARHLTNGRVPGSLVAAIRAGSSSAEELVQAALWARTPPDYLIHDFLDYNPSREEVEEERRKARERMTKGGRASPETTPKKARSSPSPAPTRSTDSLRESGNGTSRARRTALKNALVEAARWDSGQVTRRQWGRVEEAAKDLDLTLASVPTNKLAEDIAAFALFWEEKWHEWPSPQAVSGNWADYKSGKLFNVQRGRRR